MGELADDITVLGEYADHVFDAIESTIQGISDEELGWKPTPESNSVGYTLRHTARIARILLPEVIQGATTGHWADNYERQGHSLGEMIRDIEEGRRLVVGGLAGLTVTDLEAEIPLWGGKYPRKRGVYVLLGELMHHEGQIAYIRGSWKRLHAPR